MSATASSVSVNVKDNTVPVQVPDTDVARLMYYLHSVTASLGVHILPNDLLTWQSHDTLPAVRIAALFQSAFELSPDVLIGQLIFRDDNGEVVPKNLTNSFISITTATQYASIQRNVLLSGQSQNVSEVMFFKTAWLDKNYYLPLKNIGYALRGIRHCDHCRGLAGDCVCTSSCVRTSNSNCRAPAPAWAIAVVLLGGAFLLYVFYRGLRSLFIG